MKKTLIKNILCLSIAASAASLASAETVLKVADWQPVGMPIVEHGVKPWMENIETASAGDIKFEYFPAQQAGKASEMYDLVKNGVVDISHVSAAYHSSRFPLSGVAELPGLFGTTCEGSQALTTLTREGGTLDRMEYQKNDIITLWSVTNGQYLFVTRKNDIQKVGDLRGSRIRGGGGTISLTIGMLGASPINMTGPDMITSLERGTLDGAVVPISAIYPYGLADIIDSVTPDLNLGDFVSLYIMRRDRWESLTGEQRAAIRGESEKIVQHFCEKSDEISKQITEQLQADNIKIQTPEAALQTHASAAYKKVRSTWVDSLSKRKLDAAPVLDEFVQALQK